MQHSGFHLLFFGDIVGKAGRRAVVHYLQSLPVSQKPHCVIANVENATHGFGLSEKNYQELKEAGVQVMTGGNHIWDRKEIFNYIHSADCLVRPANFPAGSVGVGARVFELDYEGQPVKLAVMSLMGQVFMGAVNSPWEKFDGLVESLRYEAPMLFVDFHAEATAEKIAFAHYASTQGVSAMTGTHTHVQTADERILNDWMGYITDSGFNGAYHSVIGMMPEASIERLRTQYPTRLDVVDDFVVQVNATRFVLDPKSGQCLHVERVNQVINLEEHTDKVLAEITH